jgi:EAL domain-containing protein (putative c-di-GMP-specific phosphodiesterase class I)
VGQVQRALKAFGLDGSALCIEVKESALSQGREGCIAALRSLSKLGVQISIDEFGTGYSSLSNLLEIPVDTLKIDRSLVAKALEAPLAQRLIRGLLAMGHSLGLRVIAAGVDSHAQRTYMHDAGCMSGQGSELALPIGAAEFSSGLKAA